MGILIGLIILTLIGLVAAVFVAAPTPAKPERRDGYGRTSAAVPASRVYWERGVAVLLAIAALWFVCSISIVDARAQKVQTSFGKVTGVNGSGFNLVAPWSSGTQFSTSKQWIEFEADGKDDKEPQIKVRLAGQATAVVWGTVYYEQPASEIDDLYLDWKEEARIREKFVFPLVQQALNEAFGVYDPLAAAKQDAEVLSTYSKTATEALRSKIGGKLADVQIQLRDIDYDDDTERRLRDIQTAIADFRVATQKAATAEQIALANTRIAASLSNDPVTAFYQCSQMWADVIKETKPGTLNLASICSQYIPLTATR